MNKDSNYWKYRDSHTKSQKNKQAVLREQVIIKLGGKCAWCGYGNPVALQIDHVDGGGSKIRRAGQNWYKFYKEIIGGTHPHRVQLLCANCNMVKRHKECGWSLH